MNNSNLATMFYTRGLVNSRFNDIAQAILDNKAFTDKQLEYAQWLPLEMILMRIETAPYRIVVKFIAFLKGIEKGRVCKSLMYICSNALANDNQLSYAGLCNTLANGLRRDHSILKYRLHLATTSYNSELSDCIGLLRLCDLLDNDKGKGKHHANVCLSHNAVVFFQGLS